MKRINLIIVTVLLFLIFFLCAFFITPQAKWVPSNIKQIVFSCYGKNSIIPVISTEPECCYGLHKESYLDEKGLPRVGAMICKK